LPIKKKGETRQATQGLKTGGKSKEKTRAAARAIKYRLHKRGGEKENCLGRAELGGEESKPPGGVAPGIGKQGGRGLGFASIFTSIGEGKLRGRGMMKKEKFT